MATITLYANKVNQMPGFLKDAKKTVVDYKSELETLRKNTVKINRSVCDLDEVINGIRSSTLVQEEKAAALDALGQRCEQFIEETARTDLSVADAVRKGKEDFYEAYPYLKPEGEKNGWERMCGYLQTAGEWCREHWKLIETIVIVACAVVLLLSGVGAILAGMCMGIIFGAVLGGVSGGLESLSRGRPFMEGFEEGANAGAKRGALMGTFFGLLGAVGGLLGLGIGSATKLGMAIKGTAAVTGALSIGMGSFDLLALLDMAVDNGHNPVVEANRKLHSYKIYNIFQFTVAAVAVFTGGMAATMPPGEGGAGSQFQEVFDLADNYTLSDDTFNNHILDRHGPNSTYGNKSHFNADFDIREGIDSTLRGDNFVVGPNTAGREGYIFEQTFSNPIGTSSNGKPLYTLKVVIDETGNVITAFPKK